MMPTTQHRGALWTLRVGLLLQTIGIFGHALRRGTSINTTLFLNADLSESLSRAIDVTGGSLTLAAGVWFFARPNKIAPIWIAAWTGLWALAHWIQGSAYFEWVGPPAWAIRVGAPLVALLFMSGMLGKAASLARAAAALTFAAHGVEALQHHPKFIDLLIAAGHRFTGHYFSQSDATNILTAIGVIDLIAAAIIIAPIKWRPLALWMAFWGAVTAASRVVEFGPLSAWDMTTLRAMHACLPLVLFFLWAPEATTAAARSQEQP